MGHKFLTERNISEISDLDELFTAGANHHVHWITPGSQEDVDEMLISSETFAWWEKEGKEVVKIMAPGCCRDGAMMTEWTLDG